MWSGDYIVIDDALAEVDDENVLLGISTYENYGSFDKNNLNIAQKPYIDKVKFIDKNNTTWKQISVYYEALEHFNMKEENSIPFAGYLLNLTKNLAVKLSDYYMSSLFLGGIKSDDPMAIDLVPVLTETGGGAQMAFLNGVSAASTEKLAGSWCGDLLHIVDSLPDGYEVIKCCFADIWKRTRYCYMMFGLNDEGLIKERQSTLYEAIPLSVFGMRGAGPMPC